MLRRRAGVMAQAVQRIVDARRGEERERMRFARPRDVGAVGDAVVHRAEVGQVEQIAHQQAPVGGEVAFDVVVLGEGEVHRDRLLAGADLERDAMVLEQEPKLREVVAREEVGTRHGRLVAARTCDEAEAETRVGARDRVGAHAHEGIAGAHAAVGRFAGDEALQRAAQMLDAAVVDLAHAGERRGGVVEESRSDERWNEGHVGLVRRDRREQQRPRAKWPAKPMMPHLDDAPVARPIRASGTRVGESSRHAREAWR